VLGFRAAGRFSLREEKLDRGVGCLRDSELCPFWMVIDSMLLARFVVEEFRLEYISSVKGGGLSRSAWAGMGC
jgi:hypothetical protein